MATYDRSQKSRRGSILALSALLIVFVFAVLAFSVDMGLAYVNRAEMQRAADSAALAAVDELLEQQLNTAATESAAAAETEAAKTAVQFASMNNLGSISPKVADGDIEVGILADRDNPAGPIISAPGGLANTVRVRIKRNAEVNGATPFFFAPVMGHSSVEQEVEATASYISSFRGFSIGPNGENLNILPLALDIDSWQDCRDKLTRDDWSWDPKTETISAGPDGIHEVNLFPQDTGMPGNRGTVDIGHGGNSTVDLKRQIVEGVSADDLAYHGGSLEFDGAGELILNGDTGVSAGIKSQLSAIKGRPSMIPIFAHAAGNGNNAYYTVTKFVGVRIMDVDLSGSSKGGGNSGKRVMVQPAGVRTYGGIPSDGSMSESRTEFIYSPAVLVH